MLSIKYVIQCGVRSVAKIYRGQGTFLAVSIECQRSLYVQGVQSQRQINDANHSMRIATTFAKALPQTLKLQNNPD